MSEVLIVVSTFNRRDLTGLTLDSILRNKTDHADVVIVDDHSTDYDVSWLKEWGWPVVQPKEHLGVGLMAKFRFQLYLDHSHPYTCCLDNDVALASAFDWKLLGLYQRVQAAFLRGLPTRLGLALVQPLIVVTGYYSVTQKVLDARFDRVRVSSIGGINHFTERKAVERIMLKMPVDWWSHTWDRNISQCYDWIIAPRRSLVQHQGIHGTGVNGSSKDVAVDFVGDGQ